MVCHEQNIRIAKRLVKFDKRKGNDTLEPKGEGSYPAPFAKADKNGQAAPG